MNNENQSTKITQYADTAYKGKADPYYRQNIVGPEKRKRRLAKEQSKSKAMRSAKITGICWDDNQYAFNQSDSIEDTNDIERRLNIKKEQLRLALYSRPQNIKEVIFHGWAYLQVCLIISLPILLITGLILYSGRSDLWASFDLFFICIGILLSSKFLYHLLDKYTLTPIGQFVIFNRQTGMIEISNDERTGYHYLPFEQFIAHHLTLSKQVGVNGRFAVFSGFTLMHYQEDLMYEVSDFPTMQGSWVHRELIHNFMNTNERLADIPQFERYRLCDPTTRKYDEKRGRPANFWRRVDKSFLKNITNITEDTLTSFPLGKAFTLHDALQLGYKVPEILYFPWREAEHISEEIVVIKSSCFSRYIIRHLMF